MRSGFALPSIVDCAQNPSRSACKIEELQLQHVERIEVALALYCIIAAAVQAVDESGDQIVPLNIRFHDLRHTYAALLIAAGANPLTVKQRMGHSSITVTMDRYGHLFPHLEEDLTDRMDDGYKRVNSSSLLPVDSPNHKAGRRLADNPPELEAP